MRTAEDILARNSGLGGHDAAAIAGLHPFRTAYQAWAEKTGVAEKEDVSGKPAVRWGQKLESVIGEAFSEETGMEVAPPPKSRKFQRSEEHPFLIAPVDFEVRDGGILETKNTSQYKADEWGETGSADVPEYAAIQASHYRLTIGEVPLYVAVLIGGNDFRWFHLPPNPNLDEALLEMEMDWWERHVVNQQPPEPESEADVLLRHPIGDSGKTYTLTGEELELFNELVDAQNARRNWKKREDQVRDRLLARIGDATEIMDPAGNLLATWRGHEQQRIDTKAIKHDHPYLAEAYTNATPTRQFRIK